MFIVLLYNNISLYELPSKNKVSVIVFIIIIIYYYPSPTDAPSAPGTTTTNSLLDDFMGAPTSNPASQTTTPQTNGSLVSSCYMDNITSLSPVRYKQSALFLSPTPTLSVQMLCTCNSSLTTELIVVKPYTVA